MSAVAHGGHWASKVGSDSPTAGDSSLAQTFTVAAASTLSFYYQVVCPDTVTYDWATATLADLTTGTSSTILPKDCSKTGTWKRVTAALTAGHQYKLTLSSHDDDYTGDATYTLFDDVVVTTP
jgi:hypothetical protein